VRYRRYVGVALLLAAGLNCNAQPPPGGPAALTPAIPTAGTSAPPAAGPPPAAPGRPPGSPPTDTELVERVLAARKDYQIALEQLRAHYVSVGKVEQAHWAEEELRQYHRIAKQAYNLGLEAPPPSLQAAYNIPEANDLFKRAVAYKDRGWGTDYIDNQRRAEILLQQLLTSYPQSDKIGDAAYQLGDLYEGKAYHQPRRAALYFERCFQWNPNTQLDARIRAARIYDRALHERDKAIEIYRQVIQHETDASRLAEAQKRLQELTPQPR
jgi:TolA-binding protein